MGRLLIRGEHGHDIIDELRPIAGEIVIDKASYGAFCGTNLERILRGRGIKALVFAGVTADVCVHTTLREAYDRWFDCHYVADAISCFDPEIRRACEKMIEEEGGIWGALTSVDEIVRGGRRRREAGREHRPPPLPQAPPVLDVVVRPQLRAFAGRQRLEALDAGQRQILAITPQDAGRDLVVEIALQIGRVTGQDDRRTGGGLDHQRSVPGRVPRAVDDPQAGAQRFLAAIETPAVVSREVVGEVAPSRVAGRGIPFVGVAIDSAPSKSRRPPA